MLSFFEIARKIINNFDKILADSSRENNLKRFNWRVICRWSWTMSIIPYYVYSSILLIISNKLRKRYKNKKMSLYSSSSKNNRHNGLKLTAVQTVTISCRNFFNDFEYQFLLRFYKNRLLGVLTLFKNAVKGIFCFRLFLIFRN